VTPLHARHLVVVGMSVAAIRWLVSREREVFHVTPDEPGQLAMARFLAGGTRWSMFDHSTWRPAFAALVAPVHWLTDDPTTTFRFALGVNAVLGGIAAVLLCLLVRRLGDLDARWCAIAAVLASLLPGLLFPTSWAWAESLVAVAVAATALLLSRFVESPTVGRAVVAGAVAGGAFSVHGRLFPLALSAAGVGLVLAIRRRTSWVVATTLVASAAITGLAAQLWTGWVIDRVWEDPTSTNSAGGLGERLLRPGLVALSAVGQTWYLLASTACLAGLGAAGVVRLARRGHPTAAVVLATVVPLVAVSFVFVADRTRPDHLVYGRYNDAVIGPVLVAGVAALLAVPSARWLRWAGVGSIAVLVASAGTLLLLRSDSLASGPGVRAMVVGIQWFGVRDDIPVLGITVAAATAAILLLVVGHVPAPRRPALVTVVLVVLLVVSARRTLDVLDIGLNQWTSARAVEEVHATIVPPGEEVRFREVPTDEGPSVSWSDQRRRRMLYQMYLPDHEMLLDSTPGAADVTPFVFAPRGDPVMVDRGAEVVWRDPAVSMALWREP
jgi:hypothetical protein